MSTTSDASLSSVWADDAGLVPGCVWIAQLRAQRTSKPVANVLAEDHHCLPSVLERLAGDVDPTDVTLLVSLALNPGLSLDALVALAERTKHPTVAAALARRATDPQILETLACHPASKVQGAVLTNPACPKSALPLFAHVSQLFSHLLVKPTASWGLPPNTGLTGRTVARMFPSRQHSAQLIINLLHLRNRQPVDPIWLAEIAKQAPLRPLVLANPSCPLELLEEYRTDPHCTTAVAMSPNLQPAWAAELAALEVPALDRVLASNPQTPVSLLNWYARQPEAPSKLLRAVARNPSTPPVTLEYLAALEQVEPKNLHTALAKNPNTPLAILEQLVQSPAPSVRDALAKNPQATPAMLESLLRDKSTKVNATVWQDPSIPADVLLDRPLVLFCAAKFNTLALPALPFETAAALLSLATSWDKTASELLHATRLLFA